MPRRRRSTSQSLAIKAVELSLAAPQVVMHRVTRMARSGPMPSARDRKEMERMVAEKSVAFVESWTAMATQAMIAQQALAASFLRSFAAAAQGKNLSALQSALQLQRAGLGVVARGLAPVHRKALANAKRLGRTKPR